MFTGIIEDIGIVTGINKALTGVFLNIKAEKISREVKLGDSIAINGVCLTVSNIKDNILTYDIIEETVKSTTLPGLKINDPVNMERSLRADSRIGGHFVSGHIDYKARIEDKINSQEQVGFKVALPIEFSKFVVTKGSIALDGVSLTAQEVLKESFIVYLIPHTLKATTFGKKKKGDFLNVELDLMAKYLVKQARKSNNIEDLLKQYNYVRGRGVS